MNTVRPSASRHPASRPRAAFHLLVLASCLSGAPLLLSAQQRTSAPNNGRPRFLLETTDGRASVDLARSPVLQRAVTLKLSGARFTDAIAEISRQSGLAIVFSNDVVASNTRVDLNAPEANVAAVLSELLLGKGLDVVMRSNGSAAIVPRQPPPRPPAAGSIAGNVTDAGTGAPIRAVSVFIEGTSIGSTTREDGSYRITEVPAGSRTVIARRLGYAQGRRTLNVVDGQESTIDFQLAAAVASLEAIVTTATGEQRRVEMGNTIGVINPVSLMRSAPVTTIGEVLSGRVAGAQVLFQSGYTGMAPRVRIRGLSSMTLSNDPIIIIDGIRAEGGMGARASAYGHNTGRMADLNPEEIESLEIVKGPSAATLYGTDAANGVVVVTTKTGAAGRPQWRAYGEYGRISIPAQFPNNYYGWGHTPTGATVQCLLIQIAAGACVQDSITSWNPMQHAETRPFDDGYRNKVGTQVSGSVDRFRYFVSGDFESETGVLRLPKAEEKRISAERGGAAVPAEQIRPNALRKLSVRSNISAPLGANAEASLSNGLVLSDIRIPSTAIWSAGYYGIGYRTVNDGWGPNIGPGDRPGELFAVRNRNDLVRYTSSATSKWRPSEWLSTRATAGLDFSSNFIDNLQKRGEGPIGVNRDGRRSNQRTNTALYTVDLGASAINALSRSLTSKASIGAQYIRRGEYQTVVTATGLPPGSASVSGGAVLAGSEATITSVVAGAYAEEVLSWQDRLFFTAALRADGGSTFGSEFNTAVYPKASLSWLLSKEPWMPRIPTVSSLRFRAAYGTSGVQPSSIAALPTVALGNALVGGTTVSAARQLALGNPRLGPERQTEFETGFDFEIDSGRANLELTYYNRESRDALINRPLAPSVGVPALPPVGSNVALATRLENLGRVRNYGYEASLAARLLDRPRISVDVTMNGSVTYNKLVSLGPNVSSIPSSKSWRQHPGYPLFGAWDRPILGFSDKDGNGIITGDEVEMGPVEVFRAPTSPTQQLTAGSRMRFFGETVELSALFDYRGGYEHATYEQINKCNFTASSCLGVISIETPLSEQVRYAAMRTYNSWWGYFQDGSFTRWRELGLTIQAPRSFARSVRAQSMSLTLTGRNLALWTAYTGVDPEVNSNAGRDDNSSNPTAPPSRYWIARINLGF